MNIKLPLSALSLFFCISAGSTQAEQLVSNTLMAQTENGVFLPNGRYFVAGASGIQEVKQTPDASPHCTVDAQSALTVCTLVKPQLMGHQCFYSSLATDGTYLYSTCTDWAQNALGLDDVFAVPDYAALVRVRPGSSLAAEVVVDEFDQPVWYNGMAKKGINTFLLTQSVAGHGSGNSAIVQMKITNASTLNAQITDWLPSSSAYLAPNGLAISKGYVYFVGGQNLFRIRINGTGTAGTPVQLYQSPLTHILDDMTVLGDWIAVAEAGLVTGSVMLVHRFNFAPPVRLSTGSIQMSDLDLDPGTLAPGELIGTSYYKGGLHRIPLPF